jgi:hypothetical protein
MKAEIETLGVEMRQNDKRYEERLNNLEAKIEANNRRNEGDTRRIETDIREIKNDLRQVFKPIISA